MSEYNLLRCVDTSPEFEGLLYKHISGMTAEGLHKKSHIAAELAHRDLVIQHQQARIEFLETLCSDILKEIMGTKMKSCGDFLSDEWIALVYRLEGAQEQASDE